MTSTFKSLLSSYLASIVSLSETLLPSVLGATAVVANTLEDIPRGGSISFATSFVDGRIVAAEVGIDPRWTDASVTQPEPVYRDILYGKDDLIKAILEGRARV